MLSKIQSKNNIAKYNLKITKTLPKILPRILPNNNT